MQYDLVFEGGGAKGIVFVGAMEAFEAAGHTVRRLIGTSAGAITAAGLAAGYDAQGLKDALGEKLPDGQPRFTSFMDVPKQFDESSVEKSLSLAMLASLDYPYIPERFETYIDRLILQGLMEIPVYRNIFSFVERGGWFAGEAFLEWFTELLDAGGRNLGQATLAQFQQQQPETELTVIGADTMGSERLILNHRTAPDCPVKWAVRMSMSIPFLWQEVVWKPEWGFYRGRDISGHTIVDGGLLSNFAIDLLVEKDDAIQEIMNTAGGDINPLGCLIDENLPVPGAIPPTPKTEKPALLDKIDLKQLQTVQRITRLVDTLTSARDKFVIAEIRDRVCRLPAQGYGTTEFDMNEQRTEALMAAGRKTMEAFLQERAADPDKDQDKL
jgi:NTE family protein